MHGRAEMLCYVMLAVYVSHVKLVMLCWLWHDALVSYDS